MILTDLASTNKTSIEIDGKDKIMDSYEDYPLAFGQFFHLGAEYKDEGGELVPLTCQVHASSREQILLAEFRHEGYANKKKEEVPEKYHALWDMAQSTPAATPTRAASASRLTDSSLQENEQLRAELREAKKKLLEIKVWQARIDNLEEEVAVHRRKHTVLEEENRVLRDKIELLTKQVQMDRKD